MRSRGSERHRTGTLGVLKRTVIYFAICIWGRVKLKAVAHQKCGGRLWSQVPKCITISCHHQIPRLVSLVSCSHMSLALFSAASCTPLRPKCPVGLIMHIARVPHSHPSSTGSWDQVELSRSNSICKCQVHKRQSLPSWLTTEETTTVSMTHTHTHSYSSGRIIFSIPPKQKTQKCKRKREGDKEEKVRKKRTRR